MKLIDTLGPLNMTVAVVATEFILSEEERIDCDVVCTVSADEDTDEEEWHIVPLLIIVNEELFDRLTNPADPQRVMQLDAEPDYKTLAVEL